MQGVIPDNNSRDYTNSSTDLELEQPVRCLSSTPIVQIIFNDKSVKRCTKRPCHIYETLCIFLQHEFHVRVNAQPVALLIRALSYLSNGRISGKPLLVINARA